VHQRMDEIEIKDYKSLHLISFGFLITIVGYVLFSRSAYFDVFQDWVSQRELFYSVLLFLTKVIGIIWPPLPGGIFTFVSVPILGWQHAYLLDFSGSVVGSAAAFFIARRWGLTFINKIFDQATVARIQKVKVHRKRELEAVFMFRLFGGSFVELVCYGAGLLKIRFHTFIIGTILSHIAIGIPTYYWASGLFSGKRTIINLLFAAVFVSLFMFLKKRYFHFDEAAADVAQPSAPASGQGAHPDA
jgi:uncharacterized membrane protein YdjX (TVP38/TMEM64 family)